jgi:ribosome-binding protein aMBF1 (putative translation factor)
MSQAPFFTLITIGKIPGISGERHDYPKMARIIDVETTNLIGDKVRKLRAEKKMSQKELSDRLAAHAIFICRGSISRIESYERTVTDFELKALAEVLGVSIYDLFEK